MWRGIATLKSTQLSENEPSLHASTSSVTNPDATSLILSVIVLAKTKKNYHKVFSRCHIYRDPLKTSAALVSFQIKSSSAVVLSAVFKKTEVKSKTQLTLSEESAEQRAQQHHTHSHRSHRVPPPTKNKNNSERVGLFCRLRESDAAAQLQSERSDSEDAMEFLALQRDSTNEH